MRSILRNPEKYLNIIYFVVLILITVALISDQVIGNFLLWVLTVLLLSFLAILFSSIRYMDGEGTGQKIFEWWSSLTLHVLLGMVAIVALIIFANVSFSIYREENTASGFSARKSREYINIIGVAFPSQESQIMLGDGASITIRESTVVEESTVIIERNPEKAKSLPALPSEVIPLSDFYNFSIGGSISYPVPKVLISIPYDYQSIPGLEGELVVLFPTGAEPPWIYVPIADDGNGVAQISTDFLGDPLVGWHFQCGEDIDDCKESNLACDPKIDIDSTVKGDSILVKGKLISRYWNPPFTR